MSGIVEKLGIMPISDLGKEYRDSPGYSVYSIKQVEDLEKQRDELLEALIKITIGLTDAGFCIGELPNIVEKNAGKTLLQIKELI